MKSFRLATFVALIVCSFAFASIAQAGGDPSKMPVDNSSAEFKQIKSLAGRWVTTSSMFGKKNEKLYIEYQVVAGGAAVLERDFPGTPYEMVSLFYDDRHGKLGMTHYCIMRNRPTLTLAKSTQDTIVLKLKSVEGPKETLKEKMDNLTFKFDDKRHFTVSCKAKGDKPAMSYTYTRVK